MHRLRALLKAMIRGYGWRCVGIWELYPPGWVFGDGEGI
jgi:hypothetical protein